MLQRKKNDICQKVNADGGGGYFDLHTGSLGGFGHKVAIETILSFWEAYGVPKEHIELAKQGKNI
jgi:hypothetical protein